MFREAAGQAMVEVQRAVRKLAPTPGFSTLNSTETPPPDYERFRYQAYTCMTHPFRFIEAQLLHPMAYYRPSVDNSATFGGRPC